MCQNGIEVKWNVTTYGDTTLNLDKRIKKYNIVIKDGVVYVYDG